MSMSVFCVVTPDGLGSRDQRYDGIFLFEDRHRQLQSSSWNTNVF
jgi:hypothetical protein